MNSQRLSSLAMQRAELERILDKSSDVSRASFSLDIPPKCSHRKRKSSEQSRPKCREYLEDIPHIQLAGNLQEELPI
jgi:hypothetical protein